MKKQKFMIISVGILIIVSTTLLILYTNLSNKYNFEKTEANLSFKSALSVSTTGFCNSYNNKSDKKYAYYESMTNLYSASTLFDFTSYKEHNKKIKLALFNLYKLLEDKAYDNKIMHNSKSIYNNLLKLSKNPMDINSTNNIIKLTNQIEH